MDIFSLGFWSGLGLAVPLGPMAILLIMTTISKGRKTASFGALAMATVDFSYATLVFAIGSLLLQTITPLIFPLRVLGSLVLAGVSIQIFLNSRAAKLETRTVDQKGNQTRFGTFATFFGLTAINPATAFYFLAITPSVAQVSVGSGLTFNVFLFAFGVFFGSVIWQFVLVFAAHYLSKTMTPSLQRMLQLVGATLILVLAVWLVLK
jgi:threonine/homoserine/homoserine lactone efflux protein